MTTELERGRLRREFRATNYYKLEDEGVRAPIHCEAISA